MRRHLTSDIRRATAADAPAIVDCLGAAFEAYRAAYTPAAFADTVLSEETIFRRLDEMAVFVAVAPGPVAGVIGTVGGQAVGAGEGHIRGMAVRPGFEGRGVADALLAIVERELRSLGCTRITLDTTSPLARAIAFYERHGYRRSGAVRDFFGMDLFEYAKRLSRT